MLEIRFRDGTDATSGRSASNMAYIAGFTNGMMHKTQPTLFLIIKNLLFWGSMALTGYLLYVLANMALG
jgi:hypothetical protein